MYLDGYSNYWLTRISFRQYIETKYGMETACLVGRHCGVSQKLACYSNPGLLIPNCNTLISTCSYLHVPAAPHLYAL